MAFDPLAWAILAPIVLLASFVFQTVGFGAGLIAVPLATLFMDLRFVLPVLAVLEMLNGLRLVNAQRHHARPREALPLVVFGAIGTAIGVSLLVNLPRAWLMIGMAAFIGVFLVQQRRATPRTVEPVSRAWSVPAGLGSGIGSAMFGMGGPPYLIYLHLRALPFQSWRATAAVVGVFSLTWRLTAFMLAGLFAEPRVIVTAVALIPVAVLAIYLARRAGPSIDERMLRRMVTVLLALAAATLAARGASQLMAG